MDQRTGGSWLVRPSNLVLGLLLLYCFLSPLGSLGRFSDEEGSLGITTVLLALIAVSTANVSLKVIQKNRTFFSFVILILWIFLASFFASEPLDTLVRSGQLFIYLIVATAGFYYIDNERKALNVLIALCLGGLVSSGATIIDFMGFIDIPGVNESRIGTKTSSGYVFQASGSFARRSSMGTYYTIIITVGILLAILGTQLRLTSRLFFGAVGLSCLVALLLTHNRAGVIGASIACALLVLSQSSSPIKSLRLIFIGSGAFIAVALIISKWFPQVWDAYAALFRIGGTSGIDTTESDSFRLVLFEHALTSIIENPFGHGFSNLSGVPDFDHDVDPHSTYSQILWSAGLFGLIWLSIMVTRGARSFLTFVMLRASRTHRSAVSLAIVGGMVAFLIFNLSHAPVGTGIAWILLGVMLRLAK